MENNWKGIEIKAIYKFLGGGEFEIRKRSFLRWYHKETRENVYLPVKEEFVEGNVFIANLSKTT